MSTSTVSQPEGPPSAGAVAPARQRGELLVALVGGGANGIILLFLNISMAGLVYPGALGDLQARGVGLMLLGAALLALVTALTSALPIAIAAPQAATVVIAGSIAAGVIAAAPAGASGQAVLVTILAGIMLSSLVGGLVLYGLGATGLGRVARFLPYPVVGGFIAGVGWLFISGAIGLSAGIAPAPATLAALLAPDALARWLPAAAVGTILVGGRRWWNPLLLFPVTLIGSVALFHLALALGGTTLAAAAADGWVLGPFAPGPLLQPLGLHELGMVDWGAVAGQALNIVTMPLIAAIVMILYLSGIEISIRRDLDLDRELRAGGLGTLAGGAVGGVTGFHLLALSVLMHRMGVRSRVGGAVAAGVVALPLLLNASALNVLPRFVLGGLLIYFGYTFLHEWLAAQRRRMSRLDYGVVLLIVAVIAAYGLLPGVGVGLVAALGLFAAEYSRVRVVRQVLSGATRRSRVTRADPERRLLDAEGERVAIFRLQGYIFFGTAAAMLDTIRARLQARPSRGPRYLILDFADVTGLDSAGLYVFSRLEQQSAGWGVTVLLSAMPEPMRRQLAAAGLGGEGGRLSHATSLDRALEWCEDALVREAGLGRAAITLAEQLRDALPDPAQVERLRAYLERREAAAGERLLRQGDPADGLLFIESGSVTAQIERVGAPPLRLQTSVGGTVVGEIGLYLGAPRTSDVVCDEPCVVYRLSAAALARMGDESPELAGAVHAHLARRMAERLTHTIRALDAALDG
ncbi:MAG TPA: SulP family inorganic anion transporter [Chloroflexaceae bacterium]|nr:SulP family inorganic anion transporter [Chloroflexaceae bacterium]